MAEEPDNLVLKMLREMRGILDEHTRMHRQHAEQFRVLNKKIDDWQETTATGVGLAAHANHRVQAIETELEDVRRRLDQLERVE